MSDTRIEWADKVWNPVTGCTPVSAGCQNCYARRFAERLRGRCGYPESNPFRVTLHPERLEEPLHWRKPARVFTVSMGDLFHEDVPEWFIDRVFAVMALARWHTFIILTKRIERALEWHTRTPSGATREQLVYDVAQIFHSSWIWPGWPLPNVWPGTSVENQDAADSRISYLLQIPAAVRVVSVEPMLGPVDLIRSINKLDWLDPVYWKPGGIDWVICGGETGPDARPMPPEWPRGLRDQCARSGVPFFFKQFGEWSPTGDAAKHEYCDVPVGDGTRHRMFHVGKHVAGHFLDGQEWRQYPEVLAG